MSKLGEVFGRVVQNKIRAIPGKAKVIETARQRGRLLAVKGKYDYVEKILPHCYAAEKVLIDHSAALPSLHGFDVIFVRCPGRVNVEAWAKVVPQFLESGGVLLTTDWCLQNLVLKLFPTTVSVDGTAKGTFALRVRRPAHPLLEGIERCDGTRIVESSSYRIGVLDPKQVEIALDAPEMGEPSGVLVAFNVGKGLVVHAISHVYLQGSDSNGEYISAYILTNVIDEAMRRRYLEETIGRVRPISEKEKARPLHIKVL
jgi:hypothetical protein